MNTAVEILRREREAAAEQVKALRIRVKELDAAIELLGQQPANVKFSAKGERDLGTLVLELLTEAGGSGMFAKDIANRLSERGRKTSDASVSSTLSRLKADDKVNNERGHWFLVDWESAKASAFDHDDIDDLDPFRPSYARDATIEDSKPGYADIDDDIEF